MSWHKSLMKHGLGSPGYIAGQLAKAYQTRKKYSPSVDELAIIRSIFVERVAAQSLTGGPPQYRILKNNPEKIGMLIAQHPDLFSIVMLSIFIEHPELVRPYSGTDTFEVLIETVQEVLDKKASGWRTGGIWSKPNPTCSLCKDRITHPNACTMYAAINEAGHPEYLCAQCTMPLHVRAMSDLGFFVGEQSRQPFPSY